MQFSINETMRAGLFCALLIFFTAASAAAQTQPNLEIAIKDASGAPVAGAKVELVVGGLTVNTATTSDTGVVHFSVQKAGKLSDQCRSERVCLDDERSRINSWRE